MLHAAQGHGHSGYNGTPYNDTYLGQLHPELVQAEAREN